MKERDEELSMFKTESEKQKETIEKLNDVMEKQKSAAKKLAEVSRTRTRTRIWCTHTGKRLVAR
jgi:hypothetical protein